jgi:hypothetical protein
MRRKDGMTPQDHMTDDWSAFASEAVLEHTEQHRLCRSASDGTLDVLHAFWYGPDNGPLSWSFA